MYKEKQSQAWDYALVFTTTVAFVLLLVDQMHYTVTCEGDCDPAPYLFRIITLVVLANIYKVLLRIERALGG